MAGFAPGTTVVRRDVFRGRVWSAQALRVVHDSPEALVVACRPGAESLAPRAWIECQVTGDAPDRMRALDDLASGGWELGRWTWRDTVQLLWNPPATYFSVNAFYEPDGDHRLDHWYVNFQRPLRRTPLGFDTFDLLVDLVVAPDLSRWTWKDEDEYAQGRRLGVVDDADHAAVEAARGQVLAMIEGGEGPFAAGAGWRQWTSSPAWPAAVLPEAAAHAEVSEVSEVL
ncbi:hypothetical protein RVR_3227 [Actinacidiphila reveromycinica]|uniref:DUF402 domain-containing protein n=1 Tax=Actinacidiphila reveromycinica TaxID=659352 RepID=A0A7U3URM7_9ACTN|nr:DUF402 domain-containing protein [Streptomyces sp. SN-593]BBA97466.1 hypothetical protein RVR_3227 [Streptomyces sp. SN-593]